MGWGEPGEGREGAKIEGTKEMGNEEKGEKGEKRQDILYVAVRAFHTNKLPPLGNEGGGGREKQGGGAQIAIFYKKSDLKRRALGARSYRASTFSFI